MAFSFKDTGTTDAISYTDIAALDSLTNLSIACTIKLDTVGALQVIVSKFASLQGWQLAILTTGKLQLKIGNGTTSSVATSTTVLAANTVYRICVTYDGSTDKVIFYINGIAEAQKAVSNISIGNSTAAVTVGNAPGGSATNALDGDLENMVIWSVTLTAGEAMHYTVGGRIARGASAQFWIPCWSNAQRDLISGSARTITGGVEEVESFSSLPFVTRPHFGRLQQTVITLVTKVINEVVGISEDRQSYLGLNHVINESVGITETNEHYEGILQVVDETVNVLDGDNNDIYDPSGVIEEEMEDGTIWRTTWPPFNKRTQWTDA